MEPFINAQGNLEFRPRNNTQFGISQFANQPDFMSQFNQPTQPMQQMNVESLPAVYNPQADYGQFFRPQSVVDRNLFTPVMEKFAAARQGLETLKDKAIGLGTKGIDLGKLAVSGIGNLIAPGVGTALGMLDSFKPTYEGQLMKDFYGSQFGLDPIGRIASGPMKGYAPGDTLFGEPGLTNSINQRIARIKKTLEKKKSIELEKRLKALEELKAKEEAARVAATKSLAEQNKQAGRGGYQSSWGRDPGGGDFMGGSGTAEDMGSFKNGGIVDLL